MGNCLRSNNKVSAHEQEKQELAKEAETKQGTKPPMPSNLKQGKDQKKTVRFNLQEDQENGGGINGGDSKSGVVRIRLVVTQEELKQLLKYKKDSNKSSLEELLCAVKSRKLRRVSEIGTSSDEDIHSSWRPTLESIPEDEY